MRVLTKDKAKEDLKKIDRQLQIRFVKHFEKLEKMPPRRHMKKGIPYYVENVTKQARFTYEIEGDILYVVRCFATHKEYESWYLSFKV